MQVFVVNEVKQSVEVVVSELGALGHSLFVLLEVLLQEDDSISSDVVIVVLANAGYYFEQVGVLLNVCLSNILGNCKDQLVSPLSLGKRVLQGRFVLNHRDNVLAQEFEIQFGYDSLQHLKPG